VCVCVCVYVCVCVHVCVFLPVCGPWHGKMKLLTVCACVWCVCVCVGGWVCPVARTDAGLCPVARKDEPVHGVCVCVCGRDRWKNKTYFPAPALQSARQPRCVHSAFSAYEASAVDSVSSGSS